MFKVGGGMVLVLSIVAGKGQINTHESLTHVSLKFFIGTKTDVMLIKCFFGKYREGVLKGCLLVFLTYRENIFHMR